MLIAGAARALESADTHSSEWNFKGISELPKRGEEE